MEHVGAGHTSWFNPIEESRGRLADGIHFYFARPTRVIFLVGLHTVYGEAYNILDSFADLMLHFLPHRPVQLMGLSSNFPY